MAGPSWIDLLMGSTGGATASSGSTLDAAKIRKMKEAMDAMMAAENARIAAEAAARAAARAKMAKGGAIPPGAKMAGKRSSSRRPTGAMSPTERMIIEKLVEEAISDLRRGDPLHHKLLVSFADPYAAMHHEVEVMVTIRPVASYGRSAYYSAGPSFYHSGSYSTAFGAPPYDPAWSSRAAPPPTPKPSEPRHPYYEWCDKNP
jgi:hypothetical protein